MKSKQVHIKKGDPKFVFDWVELISFLLNHPGEIKKIGHAWVLMFDICFHSGELGSYSTTYQLLAKRYGSASVTIKKWRKHLSDHSVIESFSKGHSVVFQLKEPYLSFLKPVLRSSDDLNKALVATLFKRISDLPLASAA